MKPSMKKWSHDLVVEKSLKDDDVMWNRVSKHLLKVSTDLEIQVL